MKKEMVSEIISMLKSEVKELKENGLSRRYSKLLLLRNTTLNNMSNDIADDSIDKNIILLIVSGMKFLTKFQYDDNVNAEIFIDMTEDIINVLTKYVVIQYGHGLAV